MGAKLWATYEQFSWLKTIIIALGETAPWAIANSSGADLGFSLGGGGGGGVQKIICAHAHHEREARSPLRPRIQVWKL